MIFRVDGNENINWNGEKKELRKGNEIRKLNLMSSLNDKLGCVGLHVVFEIIIFHRLLEVFSTNLHRESIAIITTLSTAGKI